ncbi:hypothetical protein A2791_05000 [Candidatus Saccharibacteria bacterium RIFCSPHIGHO2_01_FULL_46_30]|nr:MAG: hypothetical protein A2791_05000 [Candidatus Saccharibacteria bacterium RIFCSPHIGHO2_01_FULL_46_30]
MNLDLLRDLKAPVWTYQKQISPEHTKNDRLCESGRFLYIFIRLMQQCHFARQGAKDPHPFLD